ncbi:hypothetical protein [Chitinophaga tropicalis]|uniref:Uncharacterized protein n=1 Tax=Chitinophaga tropicalis TaxID=2683588 RepID=A0A7K1TZY1_9BACT|nr:hypothetical protein [Chitinophaga tropicalis]MVT07681.1 hypothetical protein [Chitinophaga tropicalis]
MSKLFDPKFYSSLQGEDAVQARLSGMMPIMDIADQIFFVDVRIGELRAKDNFLATPIDLNNGGHFDSVKKEHLYLYNKKTQSEAIIPADPSTLLDDKNLVVIRFPTAYALDPIAAARLNQKDERAYLKQYPMVMFRKAEVMPLTPELVSQITGIKLPANEQRNKPNVKPSNIKKKSRGI